MTELVQEGFMLCSYFIKDSSSTAVHGGGGFVGGRGGHAWRRALGQLRVRRGLPALVEAQRTDSRVFY